jgi:hypothetical protein
MAKTSWARLLRLPADFVNSALSGCFILDQSNGQWALVVQQSMVIGQWQGLMLIFSIDY